MALGGRDHLVVIACVARPDGEHSPGWFGHTPGCVRLVRVAAHGSSRLRHTQRLRRAVVTSAGFLLCAGGSLADFVAGLSGNLVCCHLDFVQQRFRWNRARQKTAAARNVVRTQMSDLPRCDHQSNGRPLVVDLASKLQAIRSIGNVEISEQDSDIRLGFKRGPCLTCALCFDDVEPSPNQRNGHVSTSRRLTLHQ